MDLPGSARTPRFPCISASFNAIRSREYIHLRKQFELTLRERVIESWRELDNLTPHDYHHSSRIMRTCHTHFGVPLGISPDWWDNRKRYHKPVLPIYLRLNISNIFSRALSCLCLSGHNFLVQRIRHNRNRRPYELMSSGSLTNVTGTLFRMRSTFCWTVHMNILLAFAHSTASWSFHLSMRIAQLV